MPNIIRIRDLINETDLNGVIIPIDKTGYTYNAQQINILDLKDFILSGFTGGTSGGGSGTSGTSGVDGLDGEDGTTPCISVNSNIITIAVMTTTTTVAPVTTTTTVAPVTTTTTVAPVTTTTTVAPVTTTTTTTVGTTTTTTTTVPCYSDIILGYSNVSAYLACNDGIPAAYTLEG
ncbi:hypothetical protein M0Q97_12235, partial [Candidatus Dojkabacteria bacterium]|nr:hypothetical protein [Candidatus Dojkabacteria bacterium]